MKKRTYCVLIADYRTLKSDFLEKFRQSEKEVLVLESCTNLLVGKTLFNISLLIEPLRDDKIISKSFTKERFINLMTEYHEKATVEDIESLRFVPHIAEFIEEDAIEILASSYSEYYFYKQYPIAETAYSVTGFRVTRA